MRNDGISQRIGYVMSRYPLLSETFITREMTGLTEQGFDVEILPLQREPAPVVHPEALRWTGLMRPLGEPRTAVAAWLRMSRRKPATALKILAATARGYGRRPKEFARALPTVCAGARLAEEVRTLRLTHVHAHYATYPALAAWVAHRFTGVPYTLTVHAHDIFMTHAMLGPKLNDAEWVRVISEFNRTYLDDVLGPQDRDRMPVIHCGVRVNEYARRAPRTDPATPDRPLRVLCVGSMQPYKGQQHLLEALKLLRERDVPVVVTLVGGGATLQSLQNLAAEYDVCESVTFTGGLPQEEVTRLMGEADCYVQPSVIDAATGQMEGIPVAIMEALASALPVVASDLSGIPELVREGSPDQGPSTGWLVPAGDATALADAIQEVALDPEEAQRRGHAGRDLVQAEFDLDRTIQNLACLLNDSSRKSA